MILLSSLLACGGSSESPAAISPASDGTTVAMDTLNTPASPAHTVIANSDSIYQLPTWPTTEHYQNGKLPPYDEATQDQSLVSFRHQLYQIIKQKDKTALLDLIAEDIKFSFGEEGGKAAFAQIWFDQPYAQSEELWREMGRCLELGGGFTNPEKTYFFAPYTFVTEIIEDPFAEAIITGDKVRLRSAPQLNSQIVDALSWDHVTIPTFDGMQADTIGGIADYWYNIKTQSGKSGFVFGQYVRLPVDFRLGLSKGTSGSWQIDIFVAGD